MQIYKANVSKSLDLYNKTCIWLEEDKSFENIYQALTHNDYVSLKLFHEEFLIAEGFVTSSRGRYLTKHCFFVEDDEVIDITFDTLHKLEVREYTIVKLYTFSQYLSHIGYEYNKPVSELNLTFS
ncbi:hypothetical protein [Turicibacter sp.]|uniref:hypothetical protein n=1 Tax=Turicibacter sp. TaxID=2049042 RepID=UPI001B5349B1|nr:hypothetical protein [Turicibacter sp.]MBP3905052.1 hypothetical protein [Turicibacter sp.]MBP3908041.1 hypothetical protein [Turicibacter sp.]